MKIGIVCPYDIFRGGGVQEHVLAQAAELKTRGHDVRILTPRPRHNHVQPSDDVIFVGSSTMLKTPISTSLELGISLEKQLIDELLSEQKFDVLHVHEPEVPVIGAQIISRAKCPVVATFHALLPETPAAKTIEALRVPYSRSIFSKLAAMTAVSEVAAAFVRQHTGREVSIVPNGVDLAKYRPSSRPGARPNDKTIFYVGRLEKRKGVKYLIKAFKQLAAEHRDARLVIAGEGPARQRLEELVRSEAVPRVEFLGYVDEADKIRRLQSARLFVSPALFGESFGIVLLEAMAAGVPVVAGDNPGYRSVMTGGGLLSLVNPKDTDALAQRLEVFLCEDEFRQAWLNWAKRHVKQFTYPSIVSRYEEIYQKTAGK